MDMLRESTAAHHKRAEGHEFQRLLAKGRLPREAYGAWLVQLRHVHAALESRLADWLPGRPEVDAIMPEGWQKAPLLDADIASLSSEPVGPNDATQSVIDEIDTTATTAAIGLLGMFYVLEGSMNGNRFIARAIGGALQLRSEGLAYLCSYGESQPVVWGAFKESMRGVNFTSDEIDCLVHHAQMMFDGISRMSVAMASDVAS